MCIRDRWGTYAQVTTDIVDGLNFTGSVRYDKNENYDGSFTPRLALVYSFGKASNIRASYQTGFRNPDTQNQYIFFPTGTVTLLGTAKANAERYGIMEGGAWSGSSYAAYLNSGGTLNTQTGAPEGGNPALLQEA